MRLWSAGSLGGAQLLVERLPDQGVGEAVAAVVAAGARGTGRRPPPGARLSSSGAVEVGDPRQGLFVEVAPDRRGAAKRPRWPPRRGGQGGGRRRRERPAGSAPGRRRPPSSAPSLASRRTTSPTKNGLPSVWRWTSATSAAGRGGPGRALDVGWRSPPRRARAAARGSSAPARRARRARGRAGGGGRARRRGRCRSAAARRRRARGR